jgi:predicted ATPase
VPSSFQTNVPVVASALVGRETAVRHLQGLVSTHRAVTLIGPGGIGKTVLALEVARRLFPSIESNVFLVELASLLDPELVPSTIAWTLGLRLGGDEICPASVARAIGSRPLLLVLDNCEHVIAAAARFAETLLHACAHTTVLATSREVLRIEGESVYHVAPLDAPPPHQEASADFLGHSAVQLFIARMRSLRVDSVAHGEDYPAIGSICRRLDGIPLAIEFAAALAARLGVQNVAERLDDRFAVLTEARHTALPRHQTLRAALDWSYELLSAAERRLLRHLAIFPAGFTLDAAIAVSTGNEGSALPIINGISGLVEKSLVAFDGSTPGGRWRLLETIRAYALEKLGNQGEARRAARAHAIFFRDLVVSISLPHMSLRSLELCLREIDNVRAALDWSFADGGDAAIGVALTAAYVPVWLHSALLGECRDRTERALDRINPAMSLPPRLQLQLHMALGIAGVFTMQPVERTRTALANALAIAETLNDMHARLWTLWGLCTLHYYSSDARTAVSFAQRIAIAGDRIGDPFALVMADRMMGNTLHHQGAQREARRYLERAIERSATPIERRSTFYPQLDQHITARAMLAWVLALQGQLDAAAEHARACLEEAMATEYELSICHVLRLAACPVALLTGDLAAAETAIAKLVEAATRFNMPFFGSAGRCLEGKLLIERGNFTAGLDTLRSELDTREKSGWTAWYPEFLCFFAESLAGLGRVPEALASVDRALTKADQGGERYYVAELLRLKGELLRAESNGKYAVAIDDCFYSALAVARCQGALLLELRAALSFARWRISQQRPDEARQVLAPVYGRFAEGLNTAHLLAAKAFLLTLGSR